VGTKKKQTRIAHTHPIPGSEVQPAHPFGSAYVISRPSPLLEQVPDVDVPPDGVGNPFVKAEPDVALPHSLSHLVLDRLLLGGLRGCRGKIDVRNSQKLLTRAVGPCSQARTGTAGPGSGRRARGVCEGRADAPASQNHRIVGVGRDLCGSPSPTLLPKQGHLQ